MLTTGEFTQRYVSAHAYLLPEHSGCYRDGFGNSRVGFGNSTGKNLKLLSPLIIKQKNVL